MVIERTNINIIYITAPNDRPIFGLIQNFVWEDGESLLTDTAFTALFAKRSQILYSMFIASFQSKELSDDQN